MFILNYYYYVTDSPPRSALHFVAGDPHRVQLNVLNPPVSSQVVQSLRHANHLEILVIFWGGEKERKENFDEKKTNLEI